MKNTLSNRRNQLLAITSVIALAVIAVITIAWNTRPTKADVDCSGEWWLSTDSSVIDTCLAVSGPKPDFDPSNMLATETAVPYFQDDPNAIPASILPEPTESTLIGAIPWDPNNGPIDTSWSGVTTAWQDASVPTDGYGSWSELYVLTRPGNGASYTDVASGQVITTSTTTNPTIETQSLMVDTKYNKVWKDPQADGALYITNITNPDYTNTDPNVSYPGLQSIVYFTTKSGQTGHFDMSTETWTFDTMSFPLPTPTAPPAYP